MMTLSWHKLLSLNPMLKHGVKSDYIIDLQLFAAEDEGRTEEGSERRRREEKDKGNVPKSNELPAALVLVCSVVALYLLGNYIFVRSFVLFKKYNFEYFIIT